MVVEPAAALSTHRYDWTQSLLFVQVEAKVQIPVAVAQEPTWLVVAVGKTPVEQATVAEQLVQTPTEVPITQRLVVEQSVLVAQEATHTLLVQVLEAMQAAF